MRIIKISLNKAEFVIVSRSFTFIDTSLLWMLNLDVNTVFTTIINKNRRTNRYTIQTNDCDIFWPSKCKVRKLMVLSRLQIYTDSVLHSLKPSTFIVEKRMAHNLFLQHFYTMLSPMVSLIKLCAFHTQHAYPVNIYFSLV